MLDFGFYNMDCMEGMKRFPDKFFDLAIVDPPYGDAQGGWLTDSENGSIAIRNRGGDTGKERMSNNQMEAGVSRTGGKWAAKFGKKIISWDVAPKQEYFKELFRVSRNQIIWGGQLF